MFENLYNNTLKDLPVNSISDNVINSVEDSIAIISSPTGSGKTLTIPTRLADKIPENERVVVLVPRKFLAINAAETVAELSGKTLGKEVGYAVGTQGGDEPFFEKDSKIIFATYGYAISSGMIFYEKNIILDEVHEASMDMSIAKALINYRKSKDEDLRVIEMSATINLEKQKAYWEQYNPQAFETEGRTFDCEIIEDNSKDNAEHVLDLLINKKRKGIAVFESGVANIEETKEKIEALLLANGIKDVEVASIYGEMDKKDRDKALRAPAEGFRKVIIGTNVIESGMNIPWLDTGVTSGKGKDLFVMPSGAIALKEQDLPQWRLQQQKGRVCRFTNGVFVLAASSKWSERNKETIPEISRLPLTSLIMDCASFGLKAEDLNFDADIDHRQLLLAKNKLKRLNLIDENDKLTNLGRFANNLPVTVENAVVLKYAQSREYCLPQAIIMVAIAEQGNLRQNFKEAHGIDETSDLFDGMKAFIATDKELKALKRLSISKKEAEERANKIFYKHNMSKKRFYETKELVRDLRSRLGVRFSTGELQFDYDQLKQCLIAGNIERLNIDGRNIFTTEYCNISNTSVVLSANTFLAEPRVITPKHGGRPFTVNEKVTKLTTDDVKTFLRKNPSFITRVDSAGDFYILDSYDISNRELKSFVEAGYHERVEQALSILENKSFEEYNEFVEKNKVPMIFLRKGVYNKRKEAIILATLSQPIPENLAALEQNFKDVYVGEITIDENKLEELGLIHDNKVDIRLSSDSDVNFRINNPELIVNVFVTNENNRNIDFSGSNIKEFNISADKENKAVAVRVQDAQAKKIQISDINLDYFACNHTRVGDIEYKNINAKSMVDMYSAKIGAVRFDKSNVPVLSLNYTKIETSITIENSDIQRIETNFSTSLQQERLYGSVEDGQVELSTRDPVVEKETYEKLKGIIAGSQEIENINVESLSSDYDLSEKYKKLLHEVVANKIKENKIAARKEALREMGLKVARNIPEEKLEKAGYKDIAEGLSELDEFKNFAKGDLTEAEFSEYIVGPVEERQEDLYQEKLTKNADVIDSVITTKEKVEILKQKLLELHGLEVRAEDIKNFQDAKIKKEKEIELQEKLSHRKEIVADKLIEFFENDEEYGFEYFDLVGEDQCEESYTDIALEVMRELGVLMPHEDIDDAPLKTQFTFYDIRDDVIKLVEQMGQYGQFAERRQELIDDRYNFLADKAGYEPYNAEEETSDKETNDKERLKAAKKETQKNGKDKRVIKGLDGLGALAGMFSNEK